MKWWAILLVAALPLQWFVLVTTPAGEVRLHQVAMLAVAAVVAARLRARTHASTIRVALPFLLTSVVLYALWGLMAAYHGAVPVAAVEQLVYLVACLLVAALFYQLATSRDAGDLQMLRWAAAAAALSFVFFLSVSMLANGVNPAAVVAQSVASGDPEVIQQELFRSSFSGYGFEDDAVSGNLRHEMFAAILLAMYVSSWAARIQRFPPGLVRTLYRLSMLLCIGLLALSMSRAVLIAALAWPVVAGWRSFRRSGVTPRQVGALYAAGALAVLAWFSGFAAVVLRRFTEETSSYEARDALYTSAYQRIQEHFFTGGAETAGESSHNFILDAWLRGGVLVALAAAAVMAVLALAWAHWLARIGHEPDWMVPVVAAFALPLDRMLTAGGGLITPAGWMTIAFVIGAVAYRRQSRPQTVATQDDRARVQVPA
jgi:hypothetical protein